MPQRGLNPGLPGYNGERSVLRSHGVNGHYFRVSVFASLLACSSGVFSGAALAQDLSVAKTGSDDADNVLQEITVTANRRTEDVQRVGISVTPVSGTQLADFNVTRPEDLAKFVPNLSAIPNAGTATTAYSIRGVNQADAAEHEEQPVAVYQDGVYVANAAASGFPIFDVQRAEVLRGPQGTLFGRNATGGLIQFISNQPNVGLSGGMEATGGDYDLRRFQGFINEGNELIAARLAVYFSDQDGYIKNLNGENLLATRVAAGRGQVRVNFDPDTSLTVRFETWRQNGTAEGGKHFPDYLTSSGYPALIPANVDVLGTGPGNDLYGYRDPNPSPFVQSVNDPGEIYKFSETAAATLTHNFGAFTGYAVSSFNRTVIHYREDTDGTPLLQTQYLDGANSRDFTEELRAQDDEGQFRWTSGFFFFDIYGNYYAGYNIPTFCVPNSPDVCSLDFSPQNLPLNDQIGKGARNVPEYTLHTRSYAPFAQVEYDLTNQLTGVLGLRYTWDEQAYSYLDNCTETIANGCGAIFGVGSVPGLVSSLGFIQQNQSHHDWSGKLGLNYKLSDDWLLYSSWSKGVKSAGYSTATDGHVFPQQLSFKPEELYDLEGGVKASFLERRLLVDLSAYNYIYKDSQTFQFSGVSFSVVNKDARAKGAELEVIARPVRGLTMNIGAAYNSFRVDGIVTPEAPGGERQDAIDAPKWTGNWGVSQELPLPHDATLKFAYNGRYTGSRFYGIVNESLIRGSPYVLQDLSVSIADSSGLSVMAYANNIANRIYTTIGFDQTFNGYLINHYGPPRMLGVTVGYKF